MLAAGSTLAAGLMLAAGSMLAAGIVVSGELQECWCPRRGFTWRVGGGAGKKSGKERQSQIRGILSFAGRGNVDLC
ncbi:hypothetical protein FIBSPDRAFT_866015 [Athelia psychrophila]|uniref:Uncharacterized protein n=1 Tax=Athelia psychrophila TaxID=1759441 RepID=A0A166F1F1_9AGAM|nr:hypothetical protein FIBSPDRAFT_866015 [Fibularhizoctonia sp. CBS 109695]